MLAYLNAKPNKTCGRLDCSGTLGMFPFFTVRQKKNERPAIASKILLHDQMRYALSIRHLKYTLISVPE